MDKRFNYLDGFYPFNRVKKYCDCEEYFEKLTNIYHSLLENDFMTNKD